MTKLLIYVYIDNTYITCYVQRYMTQKYTANYVLLQHGYITFMDTYTKSYITRYITIYIVD